MNCRQRERRLGMARHHQTAQAARLVRALVESGEAARKAKKGAKGMAAQMLKRGYEQAGDGWRRLPKQDETEAVA